MTKKLLKYVIYIIIALVLFYLIALLVLFYIGPFTTLRVKQALKNHPTNVIVSLTTTPYRINKIKLVLDSISNQSIKPTKIYLNIPWKFKRDNSKYIIPEWLKSYPGIIINRTKDYGPATKLLATLEKEHDPKSIIITVDDDTLYPKHVVRDLVGQYLFDDSVKNSVITGSGLNLLYFLDNDLYLSRVTCANCASGLLMGVSGVAYKREFFKEDIFSLMENVPISCFLSDDLMLSSYILANNINIIKASGPSYNLVTMELFLHLPSSIADDALQSGANTLGTGANETNYIDCMLNLSQYNKDHYRKSFLARSKAMLSVSEKELLYKTFNYFYYNYYIKGMIRVMPFMEKLIIKTIGQTNVF